MAHATRRWALLVVLPIAMLACRPNQAAQPQPDPEQATPGLTAVVEGLERPTAIVPAPGVGGRLFVLEQPGRIRIVTDDVLLEQPFLDLTGRLTTEGEQGLLGLAFDPDFATNGRFFVNYTDLQGDTVVSSFRVMDDPDRADPDSEEVRLRVEQPYRNHNGGQLAFGPDGLLYVALGDGGSGGDPQGNGQDLGTLLGKILRLDVSGETGYELPPDNPFLGREGARGEIWAYGLRNPWRFSFDPGTGDLWIADVGQNALEEINLQRAGGGGGENYGWNVMEGDRCFEPPQGCDQEGLTLPVLTYGRDQGISVTGGYVYRGELFPALQGAYLFGDFGSGSIWAATEQPDGSWQMRLLLDSGLRISTFGTDEAGELYVGDHSSGTIYRLEPVAQ